MAATVNRTKSGAILLVHPGPPRDADVFPECSPGNGRRIVAALRKIGCEIEEALERQITAGMDFVPIKTGPFNADLVFAPDGINSYAEAAARSQTEGHFRVANLRDMIASKRARGRQKDPIDLPLLESFLGQYEKRHAPPLGSAAEIVSMKPTRHWPASNTATLPPAVGASGRLAGTHTLPYDPNLR